MEIKGKEYSVDELVGVFHENFMSSTKNGIMLYEEEKKILEKYNINYNNYSKISDLVFEIENLLNESYGREVDDLEKLSSDLAERSYYQEINK